jgi:hypothetical protein
MCLLLPPSQVADALVWALAALGAWAAPNDTVRPTRLAVWLSARVRSDATSAVAAATAAVALGQLVAGAALRSAAWVSTTDATANDAAAAAVTTLWTAAYKAAAPVAIAAATGLAYLAAAATQAVPLERLLVGVAGGGRAASSVAVAVPPWLDAVALAATDAAARDPTRVQAVVQALLTEPVRRWIRCRW